MSSRSDHSSDETYRDEETEDREGFPYYTSRRWAGTWGLWPFGASRQVGTRADEEPYEGAGERPADEDGRESLWDEGLISLLIFGGAILFLFPEPVTSALGIVLLSLGVIGWVIDWAL